MSNDHISIEIDESTARWLLELLPDGVAACEHAEPEAAAAMQNTLAQATRAVAAFDLMQRGSLIHDDLAILIYEHPEHGDEAPLMVFCKETKRFFEETPFRDCDDLIEIREWVHAEP